MIIKQAGKRVSRRRFSCGNLLVSPLIVLIAATCVCLAGSPADAAEPPVAAIAFAPNGQSVVIGSQAGLSVRSWPDLAEQQEIETALVSINDLAFSPDGRSLAAAGGTPAEEGLVEVFEWPSGKSLYSCSGHTDSVMGVSWRNDDEFATASMDYDVVVWDAKSHEIAHRLKGHSRGVATVCYLPNENVLISAGHDQNLRVWNPETEEIVRSLNNHTNVVHRLAVRPAVSGLPMVASISDDRTVRLWQPTIGRMVRFAQLDTTPLAVDWLTDGSLIVVTGTDGHVRLIDPDSVETLQNLPAVDGWAYALGVHPTDGSLLVGGPAGQLKRLIPGKPAS